MAARGQPRLDIAWRARNWVWYWMVRHESGLSDSELEAQYAKSRDNPGESLPAFTRVHNLGTSPRDPRGFRKLSPIFEAVHSEENRKVGKFEDARRAFESPFWELLTTRDLPLARLQEIIESISGERGLTQITNDEVEILETLSDDQLLRDVGLKVNEEQAIKHLLEISDLDTTALLAALYREALREFKLDRALLLQGYETDPLMNFLEAAQLPVRVSNLVIILNLDRIWRDRWITEMDWYKATGTEPSGSSSEAARLKEINGFLAWYAEPINITVKSSPCLGVPIAPPPALLWLRENTEGFDLLRKNRFSGRFCTSFPIAGSSHAQDDLEDPRRMVAAKLHEFTPDERT